jgi:tRNA(Ile)-lysidine synthase
MSWQEQASLTLRSCISPGAKVLVAVSGGPDSVALAHFMRSQPYALCLGHVDHHLRKNSARDARFVQQLARSWDLSFRMQRVEVSNVAKKSGVGLEEAARYLRYQALGAMAKKERSAAILTAHTANDQSETVLMNFLRGTGASGLAGIPTARPLDAKHHVPLVRPFLAVRRGQIMRYIRDHSLVYQVDSTNASMRFFRNRIRHSVLPYLERVSPGLGERLLQTAEIFRQEEDFWKVQVGREWPKAVRRNAKGMTVVLPQLLGYHKALGRRILRHVFPGYSFRDIESKLSEIKKGIG